MIDAGQEYSEFFPDLREKSRAEQKQLLVEAIEEVRSEPDVLNDPKTEIRPLILSWPPDADE
jgi:hypothetical protein